MNAPTLHSRSRARHREAVLRPLAGQSHLSETIVQDAIQQRFDLPVRLPLPVNELNSYPFSLIR